MITWLFRQWNSYSFDFSIFSKVATIFGTLILFQMFCAIVVMSASIFELDIVRIFSFDCLLLFYEDYDWYFQMFENINFDLFGVVIGVVVSSANLLVFCYCGELTTKTFLKYNDCLYQSVYWYDLSSKLQKYLILMISSSQRHLLYRGHGMTTLNLETFVMVCQSFSISCFFALFFFSLQ